MQDIRNNLSASVYVFCPRDDKKSPARPVVESARDITASGLGVEIFMSEYNRTPYTPDDIERLREIGRQAKMFTCHTDTLEWNPEKLRAEIEFISGLGGSALVVHPRTFGLENCDHPPSPDLLCDICKFALDSGILLAYENGGISGIEMLRRAIDIIGDDPKSTGLGICIDTGHANRSIPVDGMRAEDHLREFREIIIEVHVNDNLGTEDLHLPPGQGTIDWNAVIPELHALPEEAVICLELARPEGDPMETLRKSCEFLCVKPLADRRR